MQVCGLDDQNSDQSCAPLSNYLAIFTFYLDQPVRSQLAPSNRANSCLGRYMPPSHSESFISI
jgi:hypothetical protein